LRIAKCKLGIGDFDMIRLTEREIDTAEVLRDAASVKAGAVVLFLGTARRSTGGKVTEALEYECYAEMAQKKLAELENQVRARWGLEKCVIVHRLGRLEIGEVSVAIAVSSAHRGAAFDAGRWLIDRAKEVVPIWKRECWADGTEEWVHPGLDGNETPGGGPRT
jgi:molybdopterin synthase catalytic subunit